MIKAKIFPNGSSQAVRLPKEYRFDDSEVCIQKIGDIVILVPEEKRWTEFMNGIRGFTDDYFNALEHRSNDTPQEREFL